MLNYVEAPVLYNVLRGRWDAQLRCCNSACRHARPTAGEDFTSLQLPPVDAKSVQAALDMFEPNEVVKLKQVCEKCGEGWFEKLYDLTHFPRVLIISLNRWDANRNAILYSIEANRSIRFRNQFYDLCATVCHIGRSPQEGHYITIARHPISCGEWWFYDDASRSLASDQQVSTLCENTYNEPLKSYILIYERR